MTTDRHTLDDLQHTWDTFGQRDPMWAVLTTVNKREGRWDAVEFFATGTVDVASLLAELDALGVSVPRRVALDFGCGLGRLTQALADHFGQVHGVDIAPSMIDGARTYNRHGGRVTYHVNDTDRLPMLADGSVDFVLTVIVLQHMAPRFALNYIREFLRVLSPSGVALFHLPRAQASIKRLGWPLGAKVAISRALPRPYRAYRTLRSWLHHDSSGPSDSTAEDEPVMEMHVVPTAQVISTVERCGGRVVAVRPDGFSGPFFESVHYVVTRAP
jgi:SAM-dependent methyltransferase